MNSAASSRDASPENFVDVAQCKPDDVTIRFDEYEPRMSARGGVMGHQKR